MIYPKARTLLRASRALGIRLTAVASFPEVERGAKSLDDTMSELQQLNFERLLDWIAFCPDYSNGGVNAYYTDVSCERWIKAPAGKYRKPHQGLYSVIFELTGLTKDDCIHIAESDLDEQMATKAGIEFLTAAKWRKIVPPSTRNVELLTAS